jgi:MFS family permease
VPPGFAEYSLNLAVTGLVLSIALAGFGFVVASTGRLAGMLRDARRGRRPTGIIAGISCFAGVVLLALGVGLPDSHPRLTEFALATTFLVAGATGLAMLPIARFWTNEYWGIPAPESITPLQIRNLGRVYAIFGLAFVIAVVGVLIGLVPKLVYVGGGWIPPIFLAADLGFLLIALGVAVKSWKLFQSFRIGRSKRVR